LPPSQAAPPPPAGDLDPLVHEWPGAQPIVRCHLNRHGPTAFNRSAAPGRFRPVRRDGRIVGTLYGADEVAGALSETVFRAVPIGPGPKLMPRALLGSMLLSVLSSSRTLRLASLHGPGLRRLGATRAQIIESEADAYPALAAWGQALHDCALQPDGIVWRSRHYDDAYALMLFADRVERHDLELSQPSLALAAGPGFERVLENAERAGITVVE
jgi:hypothetical protein